ncbi:centrosomal protein of 63 kDa isoform X3 [Synchiropus splendidus]|uniref:centrosomal protein of 63 kDa isoform X3 n=1 Tax=Synchiropus splendidus TaxID=270530 RepID=UPI00237DC31D|nr:centrosomal protein of 63 kDa isoform X3 [Synchiropus splendidus]
MGTPFDDLRNSDLGSILTSCEPELQELMRQVDIMMEEQRKEWQGEKLVLEARLRSMEEELRASRELNQRMDVEIKLLRRQTEEASGRLDLVEKYKQQLHDVSAELEELKRSYQKLQQKQAKYAAKGAQAREISQLHQKIEEYQQLCTRYNKQQKTLETQNKSLVEELERVNLQFETYQKETEQKYLERCPELQCLEAQLESAREHLHVQELELERLRCLEALSLGQEGAEGAGDYRCAAKPESSEELRRLRQENSNLLTQLQAKDEVIRTLEINVKANGKISLSNVRKELENAKATILSAQACERDMKAEAKRLRDKLDQMRLQIGEHAKTETQMTEVNQLREELQAARQARIEEVELLRSQLMLERKRSERKKAKTKATEQQLALIRMVLQLDMAPGSNSKSSPEGAVGGMISTSLQRSVSPANSTVARYLEQESIHERELMQRIDSYIQAFKDGTTDIAGEHRPEEPGRG